MSSFLSNFELPRIDIAASSGTSSPAPGLTSRSGVVVISGGSAANNIVDVFSAIAESKNCRLSYIIPVSDNGGSSSELIRVLGGPGIGDVRSRLVRLIPPDSYGEDGLKAFFNHRLEASPEAARDEWLNIVEARHPLWEGIPSEKQELIRSFLNIVNLEIVKRARPSSVFNFQTASIGNLFLSGARLFTGSFESAIYLLGAITGVPSKVSVLPAVNSNFTLHICAALEDGTTIAGQNSISHPTISHPKSSPLDSENVSEQASVVGDAQLRGLEPSDEVDHDKVEDANMPGSLPTLRQQNIQFHKEHTQDLPSRISRIYYINPFGQEIRVSANRKAVAAIEEASSVVFSIGSLYTSIVPCLVLKNIGDAIVASTVRYKILILNGSLDRETGGSTEPFTGLDFVKAIAKACAYSRGLTSLEPRDYKSYVTHVIHLEGEGAPKVDKGVLRSIGIECVRVYGRKSSSGDLLYDPKALTQAMEAIMGRRDPRGERSRRNTLEA